MLLLVFEDGAERFGPTFAIRPGQRDPPDWPLHRIPYQTRITMSDTTRPVPRPAVSMDQHITKALAALIYTVAVMVGIYWMVKIGQLHG